MHASLSPPTLYRTDLHAWANTNAQLLRERRFDELDLTNLIEEVQDMGRSQQHAVLSHLRNLLMHLLKWQFQPHIRSRSWGTTIIQARIEIADLLEDNPSLGQLPSEALSATYAKARRLAVQETGLAASVFPVECPYAMAQVLDEDWLPS